MSRLDVSGETAISMREEYVGIIGAVGVGVWGYFGVLERITMLRQKAQKTEKDLSKGHVERIGDELEKNTRV